MIKSTDGALTSFRSDIDSNSAGDFTALYWYMVCLHIPLDSVRTSNFYRTLVTYKQSPSVQDFMAHTRCTLAAAEPLILISTLRFSGISTLKDTLRYLEEGLCLALHRALTLTWTGLYTGKAVGEHSCVGMVLTLRFSHKGTMTKRSTGHIRPQMVASNLLR